MFGNFVWDDKIYIINNSELSHFNLLSLLGPNIFNKAVYYRPIPAIYFSALLSIFGSNTFFYHFLQITLHIINSVFIFLIFKTFFSKKLSLLLALIFLVHPLQVESVSYIAASVGPIFTFFGLLSLLFLIKSHYSKAISTLVLTLLILASILTKETGLVFSALCILYAILFRKNVLIPSICASIFALLFYFLLRFGIGHVFFDKNMVMPLPIMTLSLFERILHIPKIIYYYLASFFFPSTLLSDQHWIIRRVNFTNFFLPLLLDGIFFFFLIYQGVKAYGKKIWSGYIFFLAWFVLGMIPHLQLVPLDMTVADRWFYFPIIGFLGIIGVVIQEQEQNKRFEKVAYIVLIILIVLFSLRSIVRNIDWQNSIYLYSHDLSKDSNNFDMQNNLGNELFRVGDYKDAKIHFQESIKLATEQSMNWTNLATVYAVEKDYLKAFTYYDKAIRNNPTYYPAYEKLGFIYLSRKEYEKAKSFLKASIVKFPDQATLYVFLAEADYKTGDKTGALKAAKKAYEILPSDYNKFILESLKSNTPIQ